MCLVNLLLLLYSTRIMKQKIGFLYLQTGAGHLSGAKILSDKLNELYGDNVQCVLMDGFGKDSTFLRLFFEKGYFATTNYFESGYIAFYQWTKLKIVLDFLNIVISPFLVPKIKRFLKTNNITKVVCLHEILIPVVRKAIDRVNPKIPLISLLMDPFTAHPIWFYEKNTELIVFSKKLYNEAVEKYGFESTRVHIFPILLSPKFDKPACESEKVEIKRLHHIPCDKKIVLIAGGGEGLKQAASIVRYFIKEKTGAYLIVVCGKNKALKLGLEYMVKLSFFKDCKILGFVSCMPELMNIADCVVTKGGPAMVMQALSIGKPLIISTYVRGQELGNMLYVVHNEASWYIPDAKNIVRKTKEILSDDNELKKIKARIKKMGIKNGLKDIAEFIYTQTLNTSLLS